MPTAPASNPTQTTIRPIGAFGSLWQTRGPVPAAPVPAPAADRYQTSGAFKNSRFNGHADLAEVQQGTRVLSPGATGPGVAAVQKALIAMAFVIPMGPTAYFGTQTKQALKNFQAMAGLPQTGTLTANTLKALDRFAPPAGKTSWDKGSNPGPLPNPQLAFGKSACVVVSISQHRVFLFDPRGKLEKIPGARTGTEAHADGRGNKTKAGVKVIDGKNADPTAVSNALWPESNESAFGTRLLGLTTCSPATGRMMKGGHSGQELHGTDLDLSIGRDYSHGCVGVRNVDIEEIFEKVNTGDFVRFDD